MNRTAHVVAAGPASAVDDVLDAIYRSAEDDTTRVATGLRLLAERGRPPTAAEQSEMALDIALPVAPEVGMLLRLLVSMRRPSTMVEFGTSLGASLIHLAAEAERVGHGYVVGTELNAAKALRAERNLADAGLAHRGEVRVGDARDLIAALEPGIDLLLLDGWKELYVDVLRAALPLLGEGAIVVADNLSMLPPEFAAVIDADPYLCSFTLPLGDGVLVAVHRTRGAA